MILVRIQHYAVVGRVTCEQRERALDDIVHLLAFALVVNCSQCAALLRVLVVLHLLLGLPDPVANLLAEQFPQQLPA